MQERRINRSTEWLGWCKKCEHQGKRCDHCQEWDVESGMPALFTYKHNASDFEKIIENMLAIHKAKNNDYSSEGSFGNFYEAERIGVPAWKGAFIRLTDKFTRACNLIKGKDQMVKDESLEDTLIDLANYSVIVLCLLKEAENEQTDNKN